ncbi:MAG: hypothetical protein A3F17_08595 [Gammaproteobacteria bacterium RIFCSPHIGHO2_12_FULL_41_15]|nr:MAG: hypothetical protein A3F17_08595 [Gammaproteobacteria bacterium RIFCSPHIGHO2_12_FULL_41_15]
MNRSVYFELCAYAFFQVWEKRHHSKKEINGIKQQIAELSKQDRFLLLDIAASKWFRKRKLQDKRGK